MTIMEFITYLGDKDFIFEDGNLVKILEEESTILVKKMKSL